MPDKKEPLRDRVNELICDVSEGKREIGEARDAILQAVDEDRAAGANELNEASMRYQVAESNRDYIVKAMQERVEKAEDREVVLVEMLRQAHAACYSEYMDCPWCSGHIGSGDGGEWHDDTCKYAALSMKEGKK